MARLIRIRGENLTKNLRRVFRLENHGLDEAGQVQVQQHQLGARQLGIAVHEASSGSDLNQLLERLKDYKLVLIDTAGLGPRDRALAAQLQWLRAAQQIRTLLVLPANTSFGDMDEVVRRFGAANLQGLVLSKLDETGRFGNALSVAVDHALPINWVTDGQDVPGQGSGHGSILHVGASTWGRDHPDQRARYRPTVDTHRAGGSMPPRRRGIAPAWRSRNGHRS